jgi:hypothetical protein
MDIDNDIAQVINENLNKNSDFEFIAGLENLTLSDIDYIERMFTIEAKLNYQIIDNIYIRIEYLPS